MKLFLIPFLIMIFPLMSLSQEEIRVFIFKGRVEYSSDNKNWENKNLVGLKLEKNMTFKVDQASEISFINKTGKVYKITTKGTYNLAYIQKGMKTVETPSFISSYAEFVWKDLRTNHAKEEEYSKGNLKEAGMVSRGCSSPLMLYPPDNSAITDSIIVFNWLKKADSTYFNFTLDITTRKYTVDGYMTDTFYIYTIPAMVFNPDTRLNWYVFPTKGKNYCFENRLYILPADTILKINDMVKSCFKSSDIDESWKHFKAATIYENFNVFNHANTEYLKALGLSDNPLIKESYKFFLKEYGF